MANMYINPGASMMPGANFGMDRPPMNNTGDMLQPANSPMPRQSPLGQQTQMQPPGSVLGPNTVRASQTSGFDPSYAQNLAISAGGLFTNPGNLSFNPFGNLSDIPSQSIGFGNAASLGLPQNWLQQALMGQGFSYGAPSTSGTGTVQGGGTFGGSGGGAGGGGIGIQPFKGLLGY